MSVAIAQVFGTALSGRSRDRSELADTAIPLECEVSSLPCRGGEELLASLFGPLAYEIESAVTPLDERFPEWGESPYRRVRLRTVRPLHEVLSHLYVLIPVLDNEKHYWVGEAELEKLLRHGEGWLAAHPQRHQIVSRYLKYQTPLTRAALARLSEEDHPDPDTEQRAHDREEAETERTVTAPIAAHERDPHVMGAVQVGHSAAVATPESGDAPPRAATHGAESSTASGVSGEGGREPEEPRVGLHEMRRGAVLAALRAGGARRVIDLGCGEGRLLRHLLRDSQFNEVVGMDVSAYALRRAADRLKLERMPKALRARIRLIQGSLVYRDERLAGFDAATLIEVIEHLDPSRLAALERVVLEFARPRVLVVTTPNREYNVMWETLPAGRLRHRDHRFEWTRAEFQVWTNQAASRHGYTVRLLGIGPNDAQVGPPTQMAVFERLEARET